jgi:hypothetical protein
MATTLLQPVSWRLKVWYGKYPSLIEENIISPKSTLFVPLFTTVLWQVEAAIGMLKVDGVTSNHQGWLSLSVWPPIDIPPIFWTP